MDFDDPKASALQLNALREQLETQRHGRAWTTGAAAPGCVGDVGALAKPIQAHAGVCRIDDCQAKLGHALSACLWSILVRADTCGIDPEAEFAKHTRAIGDHVAGEPRT